MNASAIPYKGKHSDVIDVDAKTIKTTLWSTKHRFAVIIVALAVIVYTTITSWSQIESWKDKSGKLMTEVALLSTQVKKLEADAKGTEVLRHELATVKSDLLTEIARKKALAVENTNLKGRITQGERDLAQALEKLKLYEHQQSKQKAKPKK